jgi:small subunit ribosomal protein S16
VTILQIWFIIYVMVKIRFALFGRRNAPVFRIVAIDHRRSRDGKALEILGTVNRRLADPIIKINKEGIEAWRAKGAQLSPSVHKLLARIGMIEAPTIPSQTAAHLPKKRAQERAKAAAASAE